MHRLRRTLQALVTASLLAIPGAVLAVDPYPPLLCPGLFGCGLGPQNLILTNALPTAALILVQIAAGGAVIAITIAGVQMGISYGDESKITNARKAILYALGGLGIALSAVPIVSFVTSENYGLDIGGDIITVMASMIRIILTLFNVGFCIVVILAGLRMMNSQGNADEFKKGAEMIKWAIIGGVIVNLAKAGVQAFLFNF